MMELSIQKYLFLLLIGLVAHGPTVLLGQAEAHFPQSYDYYPEFPSKYVSDRPLEVWLPSQYDTLDSLPVLYMLDGQNIFHGIQGWNGEYERGWEVDEILDSLISTDIIPPIMVVGLWNGGAQRMSEYMPEQPRVLLKDRIENTNHDWYSLYKEHPPTSDSYLQYLVKEVKPFIDQKYKTKRSRENTFVAGSSMGGLMSAYAICEYPDIFGGAACLSTHWPPLDGVFVEYLKKNLPDPATHKIYFDYGTEGLDAEYEPYQQIVDQAMKLRGYATSDNWLTKRIDGAEHNEAAWRKRLYIPVEFLMKVH